ncbi:helix-turn-helix domain-containing protein [Micromonospora phytophila]|uniref:helix-turn-helix domain-containing protein n=1 Tax=Micromonospora phytophila TaxID=709888 RepID=UPI002030D700|nr:PucR family transcriptional regulator [Micromonospora phytophila]MCM0673709.1 helix-turn-helix domain-containing protein [Micromonospora phytophila]
MSDAVRDIEPRLANLGAHVGEHLRRSRDALHARLLDTVRAEMRSQGRSLTGDQGRGLSLGVETAVTEFVEAVADPARDLEPTRAVFRALGRTEFFEGHQVDALRTTLTIGAREIWSFLVESGTDRLSPEELYVLAAALFGYVDALAGSAAEGYLQAQQDTSHDLVVARRRLVTLLVQADPPGDPVLRAASDAARWPLPASVAVAAVEGTDADHLARAVGGGTVGTVIDNAVRLVVADPETPGRLARLRHVLAGRRAALGPNVPLASARQSYRLAARALLLQGAGQLPVDRMLCCEEYLLELLTQWEPGVAELLAARVLAPLQALPEASRQTLFQTLYAWLRAQGQVIPTAAALHAHPQTVRYRLRTLRRLFGAQLQDPDVRLRLHVALERQLAD